MKRTFPVLRRAAARATHWRGHRMRWMKKPWTRANGRSVLTGVCQRCGMHVQLLDNPMPNEVHISGSALALTCGTKER